MTITRKDLVETLRSLATVFLLYIAFTTVAFGAYHIPSESMVPTLKVGDRIFVSKFAYGYSRHSLPFGAGGLLPASQERLFGRAPKRGDIVVFVHPRTGQIYIKRLIGLPGDEIRLAESRLFINGAEVPREARRDYAYREYRGGVARVREFEERLPERSHAIIERGDFYPADSFGPARVPEGHYFFMGDNRDNSTDSRFAANLGFVPAENLVGRAEIISFSFAACAEIDTGGCDWRALTRL